jgi:hypothetical protein
MITHGAMVLPVGTRGRIDPSANAKPVDAVNLKVRIDHRHSIASHLRGAGLVPERARRVTDELVDCESPNRSCDRAPST